MSPLRFALPLVLLLSIAALLSACDAAEVGPRTRKLVPDSTVFIAATLEASPDTSFHHAQVYVGRLSDPLDPDYDLFADPAHKPNEELWMPIQWAQVGMKLRQLRLRPHPDGRAEVWVTGPLGHAEERRVTFRHERRGAYGDVAGELVRIPHGRYRLDVRLADGRAYMAETTAPGLAEWVIPDTFRVPVSLDPASGEGTYGEVGLLSIEWAPAPDAVVTATGANRSLAADRFLFGLGANEHFPYEDRNDWVRAGAQYFVFTTAFDPSAGPALVWAETSTYPLVHYHDLHLRLYQLGPELSRYYAPEDIEYTMVSGDPWAEEQFSRINDAVADRDTTYLRSVSNVLRVGADGHPLPHAQSDAVGVFGAYTARYARSAMVPVRDFDPDSLGWGSR